MSRLCTTCEHGIPETRLKRKPHSPLHAITYCREYKFHTRAHEGQNCPKYKENRT